MRRRPFLVRAVLAAAALSLPTAVQAQAAATPPPAGAVVRWNNGLHLESPDGEAVLQIGTLVQFDGRLAADGPPGVTDSFLIRRGRLFVQARLARRTDVVITPEFAGSVLNLLDVYLETRLSGAVRLRVGRSKSPLGLEHLYSDAALPFAERTLGSNLSPNRDVGVTVLGQMWGGRASYAAGVLNGVADAASGDLDVNDGKDLVARGVLRAGPISLALAGSRGRATGTLAGFRTTAQQTFFVYAPETQASGLRRRVTPSMAFYQGRFGGFVEYFRNTHAISRGGVRDDVTHQAWTATAIVVLTGESLSDRGAAPRAPFSPADGHWGALQVGLRYSELSLDERTFGLGLASDGSSRRARATGVSLVWYHSTHVKHVLTIERTTFLTPVTPRRPELAAIYRAQVNLAPGF